VVREIPRSFPDALSSGAAVVDTQKARQQHAAYVSELRKILLTVRILPALDAQPDSVFVEDTTVAIGRAAVMTRPGHTDRQGEVDSVKSVLQDELGMDVTDMREESTTALCDGGDVMWTGRHLFVGMSERTNQAGASVLREVFSNQDVVIVPPVLQGVLHLKSAVTHLDEHTLVAPVGGIGDAILAAMEATEHGYQVIRLPDIASCNVVSCNRVILAPDVDCSTSRTLLEEAARERNMQMVFLENSEVNKKDGALTCCSILLDI
jgi:dimethylargininase